MGKSALGFFLNLLGEIEHGDGNISVSFKMYILHRSNKTCLSKSKTDDLL